MAIYKNTDVCNENVIMIECDLIEETQEALNEAIVFKFVKKEDVPEDFKKFAMKMAEEFESGAGKKKLGSGFIAAAYGLRLGKVKEKIEKKAPKNTYMISIPFKAVLNATDTKKKWYDSLVYNPKMGIDYCEEVFKKVGLKKASSKAGSATAYWKQGKDCIYNANVVDNDGQFVVYIRCLQDIPENKEVMVGGKRYVSESVEDMGIFSECSFI